MCNNGLKLEPEDEFDLDAFSSPINNNIYLIKYNYKVGQLQSTIDVYPVKSLYHVQLYSVH